MTTTMSRHTIHETMLEDTLQTRIIDMAKLFKWHVQHTRPARSRGGDWRTPIQGDKGFPDLVLARDGRVIFAELKTEGGRPTADQEDWLRHLRGKADANPGRHEVYIWRPHDLPDIERLLR